MSRIAVLFSGGVDSAAAALLLQDAGHDIVLLTLRLADGGPADAAERAAQAAAVLGLEHRLLDLRAIFARAVIEAFAAAYRAGRTPNPCVDCNPRIKFGLAFAYAVRHLGAEQLATGHYARLAPAAGGDGADGQKNGWRLGRARCRARDQSYFLYRVPTALWPLLRLPLGEIADKNEARARAAAAGLHDLAAAPDSMDVCFLPGGDYRALLAKADGGGDRPGDFVDRDGRVLGRHPGHAHFTVGQRRGLGKAFGKPVHVLAVRPADNTVVLGDRDEALRREVAAGRALFHTTPPPPGAPCFARIRSGGEPAPCVVVEAAGDRVAVRFDQAVFAPAAGQHLVLYDANGWLIGGGEIIDHPAGG